MSTHSEWFARYVRERTDSPPERVFKYVTPCAAQKILSNGKLLFQSPLNYNDPFDCQWNPYWQLCIKESLERLKTLLLGMIDDPSKQPGLLLPEVKAGLDQLRSKPPDARRAKIDERVRVYAQQLRSPDFMEPPVEALRPARVCCFIESYTSLLMWSHYAEQHTGVALGFDSRKLEEGLSHPLRRVRYKRKLPKMMNKSEIDEALVRKLTTKSAPSMSKEDIERLVLTKHVCWEYEKEWRIVDDAGPGATSTSELRSFPPESLVQVVFGCRADRKTKIELTRTARESSPDVELAHLQPHTHRFQVVPGEGEEA